MKSNQTTRFAVMSVLAAGAALWTGAAAAQTRSQVYGDDLTKQSHTFYIRGDVQATTHKSEVADSKDTSETAYLNVGGWVGEGRSVGIEFLSSDVDATYTSPGVRAKNSFRDVRLMTRLGWLIPSIGANLTEIDIRSDAQREVGLYSTGVNAGLKIAVPVTIALVVHAEAAVARSTKSFDKLGGDAKLGQRTDADIGASYDLTDRVVDLLVGYKLRTFEIESSDRKYKEGMSGAYAGLRLGVYF